MIPIIKKEKERVVEEYRKITLMATGYKVYMTVLAEKTRDSERKKAIPHKQTGFRKKLEITNNVYVLNYLLNRQLRKGKKVITMFVDLKAAFNTMDKDVLGRAMREKGIREGVVVRVEKALRKTRIRVRTRKETEVFGWQEK